VQEWSAVVQTMNRYADGTLYFGLVVCPTGFTSGCEAWATSHNLGIVPPLKGRRLSFEEDTVLRMFERVIGALKTRVRKRSDDLAAPPAFFDFVYRLVSDFEGHQEATPDGRYSLLPRGWPSSFGELYHTIGTRTIRDLWASPVGTALSLSGDVVIRFGHGRIEFGHTPGIVKPTDVVAVTCYKNPEVEPCTIDFVRSIALGKTVSSAGDFGGYLEVGLAQRFNLGLHDHTFHIISTENPLDEHRL
jgi:hypothetical protein